MIACKMLQPTGQLAGNLHQQRCFNSVSARLLILGAKQTGKSATIVRYTTGRYIQQYNEATTSWLYRRSLGFDERRNSNSIVELMEQKDIKISNTSNLFDTQQTEEEKNSFPPQANQSLASRVASDQRIASELHDRQELLNKLHWANAYVIIYALNDAESFNKAIKYLNLIANHINSNNNSPHSHLTSHLQQQQRSGSSSSNASSTCSTAATTTTGGYISTTTSSTCSAASNSSASATSGGTKLFNLLTSVSSNQASTSSGRARSKRPILLLANKRDLEVNGRQVSTSDGRILAQRHQSLFAEISVAESRKLVESGLSNLLDQIDTAALHIVNLSGEKRLPLLTQWIPNNNELNLNQSSYTLTAPVWASFVKSKPISYSLAQSNRLPVAARLETDVQVLKSSIGSVQVAKSCQVMSSLIKPMSASNVVGKKKVANADESTKVAQTISTNNGSTHSYHEKYETLKSSFKRASMAIVSSKVMSRSGASNSSRGSSSSKSSSNRGVRSKGSSISSDQESINEFYYEPTINEHRTSESSPSWIKSHIKSFNQRGSRNAGDSNSIAGTLEYSSPSNYRTNMQERLKRPLFRYKNRRKTVAFEATAAATSTTSPIDNNNLTTINTLKSSTGALAIEASNQYSNLENINISYNQNENLPSSSREFISRSSSSMSITEDYYVSINNLRDSEQTQSHSLSNQTNTLNHQNSTSNLSKSFTLGRKDKKSIINNNAMIYHELIPKVLPVTLVESIPSKNISPISLAQIEPVTTATSINSTLPITIGSKKRYGIVKTVQNTISNLTGSSNVSGSQATTKRSFCSALFKHPHSSANLTPITVKKVNQPIVGIAKTEHIQAEPALVGYCK